ncbi:MAG: ketopantoate reductase family protein, partial [Candidatus Hodarchaeota archaeon]
VGSHIEKPGIVTQSGNPVFFYCGKDPKFPDFNPQPIFDFFNELGMGQYNIPNAPDPNLSMFNWREDPYPIIWEKYLLVASFALVTAYSGKTLGGVIFDIKSLDLLKKVMKEIVKIAEKKNIKLPDNIISKTIELCKDYTKIKTSYQRDIEKGKRNEGDLFGGTIIRLGQELGVPTPVTKSLYSQIKKKVNHL